MWGIVTIVWIVDNAVLLAYRGLSNVVLQAYGLCNADIQAYADHAMTEELNVESTRSLV